ncbi:Rossmann-like and DUF2520 domain-containing protein [Herpetosiphon sp. NSE202]|uniref:Rossmann-like and DUF2520 domain-containing protein n=1 Tax=Herpetosiphon sp. NSE202 TaxID=3351349 RepID=UPI003638A246
MAFSARPTVGMFGAGKVGTALALALKRAGYSIAGVSSRSATSAQALAQQLECSVLAPTALFTQTQLIFLTIPDDQLAPLAQSLATTLPQGHGIVAHCSGALTSSVLQPLQLRGWQVASCHPLAPFASRTTPLPQAITWAIEAEPALYAVLDELVHAVGGIPRPIQTEHKVLYHSAAVLSANYAITLAARAVDLLQLCGWSGPEALQALVPLLRDNVENLARLGLPQALTGPLARGDYGTVERHLQALDANAPEIARLYRACIEATQPLLEPKKV